MFKFFKKKVNPTDLCVQARTLVSQGKVAEALALLDQAIKDSPHFSMAYADRGTVYAMTGRHQEAILDLNKALDLGFDAASVLTTLATVQKEQGDHQAALTSFAKAESLTPGNPLIYYNRASLHITLGDWVHAIADLKKCLTLQPDPRTRALIEKRLAEVAASSTADLNIAEVPHDNGQLRFRYARVMFADAARWIRHGLFTEYSEAGQRLSEGHYVQGQEHGLWRDFHPNGQLAALGEYVGGKEHGIWRFWDEAGTEGPSLNYVHGEATPT
ncbi:tetratricopeptide repeat protein [Piscinibacter terrae]|uniref:tetratricopeptide repeat protein n=1 Tax=Piscinibacter terrae TaxID=2496871 RepID=UPI000F5954B1|nr:tetratricopeptide repeat protein [Albitalea terrae]